MGFIVVEPLLSVQTCMEIDAIVSVWTKCWIDRHNNHQTNIAFPRTMLKLCLKITLMIIKIDVNEILTGVYSIC